MSLRIPGLSAEVVAQLTAQGVRNGELAPALDCEPLEDGSVRLTFTLRSGRRVPVEISGRKVTACIRAAKALS